MLANRKVEKVPTTQKTFRFHHARKVDGTLTRFKFMESETGHFIENEILILCFQ